MFLSKIISYIFGYVIITVVSGKPERFIDMLIKLRVRFWNIKRNDDQPASIVTAARFASESHLHEIAVRSDTAIKISKRIGVRYLIERHRMRLGMYLGMLIGMGLLIFSTFFVWEVRIDRSDYNSDEEIYALLGSLGVSEGAFIPSIDFSTIKDRALLANDKLGWIAVNIQGTIASVEVKTRDKIIPITDTVSPCNVIAARAGKIIRVDTYDGKAMVASGDLVRKGDLIISGTEESATVGIRVSHAEGKVMAETTRIIKVRVPFIQTEREYTGREIVKNSFRSFGRTLNMYLGGDVSMERFERTESISDIVLLGAAKLPVKLNTITYREYVTKYRNIDENTAKVIANSKISGIIDSRFNISGANDPDDPFYIEIIDTKYTENSDGEYFYLTCSVKCIENIAEELPFYSTVTPEG
ncbi:hypothetical protein FACS1894219_05000 [Clostridia bacterium]|nr:hypothetical protein FACS1894219_05000 [Clostridia bacterium]